jgi:hypothetical protein
MNTDEEKMLARMDVFEEKLNKMNAARKVCLGKAEANTETAQEPKKPAQQLCQLKDISYLANKSRKLKEELIAYFPFIITFIYGATSRKKNLVWMRNEVNKTIVWEASVLVLLIGVIFRYTVDMVLDGVIYIPTFRKIGSGIQVILRLLPRQLERLYCWYY